jgi:signal transduction histidine kinase
VYAIGLSLQESRYMLKENRGDVDQRLGEATESLGQVLRDLRNYIMGLRTGRFEGQDVSTSLGQLAAELRANTLMNVSYEHPDKTTVLGLDEPKTEELLLIAREALNNIRKHAQARNVTLSLKRADHAITLEIVDDGIGFDPQLMSHTQGNGLRNMQERARALGGTLQISSQPAKGTSLLLSLPTG